MELSASPGTARCAAAAAEWKQLGMDEGQMRDTKMSDSLPTVVAMRSNSQHQSDKLSDRMVQPAQHSSAQLSSAQLSTAASQPN